MTPSDARRPPLFALVILEDAQVRAEVEQIVLDGAEELIEGLCKAGGARSADDRIQLVNGAVRLYAQGILADPLAAAQRCRAVVSTASVNLRDSRHDRYRTPCAGQGLQIAFFLGSFPQSGNNLRTDMIAFDSQWAEALAGAVRSARNAGERRSLFLEKREDLAVSFARGRSPAAVHTFWSGMAARTASRAGQLAYRSNPAPDDAVRLLNDPHPGHERASDAKATADEPAVLAISTLEECFSAVEQILTGFHPEIALTARGVAFEQRIMVARADRSAVEDIRRGSRIRVECMLVRGDRRSVAVGEAVLAEESRENLRRVESVARSLAERIERRLDARIRPAGQMPVVFAPGVGGVLVHEIVGHALEADEVLEEGSWLAELEEQVAPTGLLVLDDPRRGRASWRIDDEAEEARPTPLVRDGRVAGWLLDRATADRTGRTTTGHGRCSSFRERVRPRMGCTFVAPGGCKAQEVISGVQKGIYVRRMEAGKTDIRTGRALFRVTDADLIRNGALDAPLLPHLLRVDGAAALSTADRVADDLQFDSCIGSCHRDGQPLAISVGAPTFCIGRAGVC